MVDENALKRFLKALIDQAHWNAVVAADIAKRADDAFPTSIDDVNASFNRLRDLLELTVIDESEQHDEDPL